VAWFSINFGYFLAFKEKSKIQVGGSKVVGQVTSFDIIWRRNQQIWHHFVEQVQGYLINVSLVRCALTERNPILAIDYCQLLLYTRHTNSSILRSILC